MRKGVTHYVIKRQIDPVNVDILLFSCRTRLGKPQ
jgi:hypothetical protein